jgi:biopolymer transport protein ExbD
MRLRKHFRFEEATGIDLAPMLDFVLNLLIFFIITAVFTKELSLAVSRPAGTALTTAKETGSILVNILDNGEIWLDNRVVDARAVRANVERLHALKPEYGVLVVADEDVEAGLLVQVVDQVRLGGVENITFGSAR